MAGYAGLDGEAGDEVPARKVESGANDEIRNFGDGLSSNKSNPAIGFRLDIRLIQLYSLC